MLRAVLERVVVMKSRRVPLSLEEAETRELERRRSASERRTWWGLAGTVRTFQHSEMSLVTVRSAFQYSIVLKLLTPHRDSNLRWR